MMRVGYALSSEEHHPSDLVRHARLAEQAGFDFVMISDHFHPWLDRQGNSPFVWSVIGGIAATTERVVVGTGVTCPIIRIHPAILAQAAATAAAMLPGRFVFGVGTGENLNEHVLGDKWPPSHTRRAMLEEAIQVIRELWSGDEISFDGDYYAVENARLYTLPDEPPPIAVAASGSLAAELAGRIGDALVATAPDRDIVDAFDAAGGDGKPRYGQVTVCWGEHEARARRTAFECWPNTAVPGELSVELPSPGHYEQAIKNVREEDVVQRVPCGPDAARHLDGIRPYVEAGFDHVYVHQIGPEQEGFLEFAARELLPSLRGATAGAR
jgi:coenzyme F420-dependent glucose-6-phosphate dehydrogenase